MTLFLKSPDKLITSLPVPALIVMLELFQAMIESLPLPLSIVTESEKLSSIKSLPVPVVIETFELFQLLIES